MAGVIGRLGTYFRHEFAPDKLKWDRIVEDEKKGRNCPQCGRFGFYIHLPTSIREYWWGMYRCKGCKKEYRPRFTKGNMFFLAVLGLFYFNYFGQKGFSFITYLTMAVGFAFTLGVNYVYVRMGRTPSRKVVLLGGLGWFLAAAATALAHHGEGVANFDLKDILYLLGSTGGFTFAGGSVLGLIPGVQRSIEDVLDFLISDEEPLIDESLGKEFVGFDQILLAQETGVARRASRSDGRTLEASSDLVREEAEREEGDENGEGFTMQEDEALVEPVEEPIDEESVQIAEEVSIEETTIPGEEHAPEGIDPDYERQQMEWWRQNQEDERIRLESYKQHRQGDPDYEERVKDMEASLNYYNQKVVEQQGRLNEFGIQPAEHKPVNEWDPFKVSQYERDWQAEQRRRQRWSEAFDKFEKMREGAERRGHELYSDPGKWDKGMDQIFREDGEVDYTSLNRARRVFQRSIEADIDTMAPEQSHWATEATIDTVRDAKNNPVVRIGSVMLTGGTSEIVFEPLDQLERMHEYVQYHDKGGSDWEAIQGGFNYGIKELTKDKLAIREIKTLWTGQVEMPDGTTREAGTWDKVMSVVGLGLKGRDLYSTTVKGEFWNQKAFGVDLQRVDDKGAEFIDRLKGGKGPVSLEVDGPTIGSRRAAAGGGTEPPGGSGAGTASEGSGPLGGGGASPPGGGGSVPPKIPSHMVDDYKAMQQAIADGDSAAANRYATRMMVKDQPTFRSLVRDGTIDSDTAQRAVGTQQVIVADGVKEGLERTKRTGRLFEDRPDVDAQGRIGATSPVKHIWSPGTAMEPFDPKNPKVPGDVDLTPVVDRPQCRIRGLDPDDVQRIASGHTKDAINDVARRRLGDDIGDFTTKTKVKPFVPGSEEEYLSYSAHKMEGRVINSRGDIVDNKTTLGEESWPRSREAADILRQSDTGRAMVAADESIQINKTLREFEAQQRTDTWKNLTPEQKEARYLEAARETSKHHTRLEASSNNNGAGWKRFEIDKTKLNSPDGFGETLDATRIGHPDTAREAINRHYNGDYKKFYEDVQTSANQAVERKLKGNARIWDAQADALKERGVQVQKESIIPHTTAVESKDDMLRRFGVGKKEQHVIEWENQIRKGETPTPRHPDTPLPSTETEFVNKDKGLGIQREAPNLWGAERPPNLEKLAQEHSDFAQLDDMMRKPWKPIVQRSIQATVMEEDLARVYPHGTYAAYMEKLEEQNIFPDDPRLKLWIDAVLSEKWPPPGH